MDDSADPGRRQMLVRACRTGDRAALMRLGHPPAVGDILSPRRARRIAWRLLGTRSVAAMAVEKDTGAALGSIQFLRSRRDRNTWLFGHWRVAAGRRREGIGRRLLREGARLLPAGARLYSYVDWGNEASIAAHERCGFEAGRTLHGSAPLGVLSTIGAPTPALRLEPARPGDRPVLFGLYARAMGSLWLRLFPRLRPRNYATARFAGYRLALLAHSRVVDRAGGAGRAGGSGRPAPGDSQPAGFVLWEGDALTFFADPEVCDAALLARVALQLVALGAGREATLELRGLPRALAARPGAILAQILMGMPDPPTQWRE